MSTSYNQVFEVFTNKITDFEWHKYIDAEIDKMLEKYMISACVKFRTCKVDLSDRDSTLKQFNVELDDEVIDIITTGMIVEWLSPKVYHSNNLQAFLNTRDFNIISPANLLSQVKSAFNECKIEFKKMITDYSYNHGKVNEVVL